MMDYKVFYEIRSGIDGWHDLVASGDVLVRAHDVAEAAEAAVVWVRENDSHFDVRIDPMQRR
jgi:hypothetical protein